MWARSTDAAASAPVASSRELERWAAGEEAEELELL